MIRLDENTTADLPFPEIMFYPNDNQILVNKCDPNMASSSSDPECYGGVDPYFKTYIIEITG